MPKVLFALLLALSAGAFAATPDFTPAERAQVRKLVDQVRTGCAHEMAVAKPKQDPVFDASSVGRLFRIDDWPGYCPCVAAEMQRRITPQLLRLGSKQQGEAVTRDAATACVVRRLQERFPPICHAMVDSSAPDSLWQLLHARDGAASSPRPAIDAAAAGQFCQCMQADIDKLDADNFQGFAKLTMFDYADYHRTGRLPDATGPSMLAMMQRCGLVRLFGATAP